MEAKEAFSLLVCLVCLFFLLPRAGAAAAISSGVELKLISPEEVKTEPGQSTYLSLLVINHSGAAAHFTREAGTTPRLAGNCPPSPFQLAPTANRYAWSPFLSLPIHRRVSYWIGYSLIRSGKRGRTPYRLPLRSKLLQSAPLLL